MDKRPWGFWTTSGFGIAIIVVFLLTMLLVSVVVIVINIFPQSNLNPSQILDIVSESIGLLVSLGTITTAIVGVGLIIAVISIRREISIIEYLALKPVSTKAILVSLAIVVVLIIAYEAASMFLDIPINPQVMVDIYNTSVWPALFWIAVVIFAPIFEETFFRGFLFKGFIYSKLGISGTIILTAFAWTLLHLQYGIFGVLYIFIAGIFLGVMRYKTGSLWVPLIMHSFINMIAVFEIALNVNSWFS
ncbi:lysostaphin resistance A-like protein [Chloroflexota bacterium]